MAREKDAEEVAQKLFEDLFQSIRDSRLAELEELPGGRLRCRKHGHEVNPDDPALSCPGCTEDERRRERAEERRERLAALWPIPTLPRWPWARLSETSWRERVAPKAVREAARWEPGIPMLMSGPTGTGKTSSMVARMWDLRAEALLWAQEVRDGPCPLVPALYATEIQLVQARRRHPLGYGEAPLVEHAMRRRCLILDEVGATGELITHEIVDERQRRGLTTVALTGFELHDLVSRVGDACVRRLEQCARLIDLYAGRT
jgi:hypothetical protein